MQRSQFGLSQLSVGLLACLSLSAGACDKAASSQQAANDSVRPEAPSDPNFIEHIPPIPEGARRLPVTVNSRGYDPASLEARPGETVVLAFTRTTKAECGRYVIVQDTETRAELPLKKTIELPVTMPASGEVTFACGMDMMHGVVKVVSVGLPPAAAPVPPPPRPAADPAKAL